MAARKSSNQLRIIGGQWRGRKLTFPDVPGLRPTGDRVRETLFNWLAPVLPGARCLDLFAGSGALGLEAASRGAGQVVMVESDHRAVEALRDHQQLLDARQVRVVQDDALRFLDGAPEPFQVVFLDPPFDRDLWAPALERLLTGGWLANDARVYLEMPRSAGEPVLPAGLELHRSKCTGDVGYHLARYLAP